MDRRTKGIIATIATVALCGCPGLFLCIFGALAAAGAPVTTELNGVTNVGQLSPTMSFVLLCLGLIFIAIPIGVGFFTLRKKRAPKPTGEPMPPAS